MEMEFDLPVCALVGDVVLRYADSRVKLTIEHDYSHQVWHVAAVELLGNAPGEPDKWHRLPDAHIMARTVREVAYGDWRMAIQLKWEERLQDEPVRRTPFRILSGGRS